MCLRKAMKQQDWWSGPRPTRENHGLAGIDLHSFKAIEHVTRTRAPQSRSAPGGCSRPQLGSWLSSALRRMCLQLVDQNPAVFRIIYRHRDDMGAAAGKSRLERGRESVRSFNPAAFHVVGARVCDEIRIAEGHPEIRKTVGRLLPADHPESIVLQD